MNDFASLEKYALGNFGFNNLLADHIRYRFSQALQKGQSRRALVHTLEDITAHQRQFRRDFEEILGGLLPIEPRVEGIVLGSHTAGSDLVIQRVAIPVRTDERITAHLYLCGISDVPRPAILFLCGHTESGAAHPIYQKACQVLARAGFVVLAVDPIGQGERMAWPSGEGYVSRMGFSTDEHVHLAAGPLLRGENLLRYMLHDNQTALTYLAGRPEVEPTRLGVTGNSGGGLQSAVLSVFDARIAALAPGTWLNSMEWILRSGQPQDSEQVWHDFVGVGYDHHDLVLASCPKPFLMLVADFDFFPLEGCLNLLDGTRRYWDLAGAPGGIRMFRDSLPHSYTPAMADAAAEFFCEIFGVPPPSEAAHPSPLAEAVFFNACDLPRSDSVPSWALAPAVLPQELDQRVRAAVESGRRQAPPNLRFYRPGPTEGLITEFAWWWTQPDLVNFAFLFRKSQEPPQRLKVFLWNGGTNALAAHRDEIQKWCTDDWGVCVLDLTGMGRFIPAPLFNGKFPVSGIFGDLHTCAENLSMLGDELLFLRVWDLKRFFECRSLWPSLASCEVDLVGCGKFELITSLAARIYPELIPQIENAAEKILRWLSGPPPHDPSDMRPFLAHGLLATPNAVPTSNSTIKSVL